MIVVLFIGNTFVERAQNYGQLESAILAASSAKNLVFRNLRLERGFGVQ